MLQFAFAVLCTLARPQSATAPRSPVADIDKAVTYVVAEGSGGTGFETRILPRINADVLVRAWFKWHQAPPVASWRDEPVQAHALGALFGGGITCSALYDDENGLTPAQVQDMATRDPSGNLVDAWGQKGIRHGSLSNPRYQDYLFRWCKEQIDAGADYLFMDERDAALSDREGYDDASLADFTKFLPAENRWAPRDPRWRSTYLIDLDDRSVCPDGTIGSFRYRAYLTKTGHLADPTSPSNPLASSWARFKTARDDRVWESLTDRIRQYGASLGKKILISANGFAPYVDLQVLGVWNHWRVSDGHVDFHEDMIPVWRSIVRQGQDIARKPVPVVLFHDWGFGNPPFPFLAVPPQDRENWLRTRAAEIYAAGGYFAFPVLCPGYDAEKAGALPLISHLTAFYEANRDIYTGQQWAGHGDIRENRSGLSVAADWLPSTRTLAVHVINRNVQGGKIQNLSPVTLSLPVSIAPDSVTAVSPDSDSPEATAKQDGDRVEVQLPSLEAYTVVLLHFSQEPRLDRFQDSPRYYLEANWQRPSRSEFQVLSDGTIENSADLNGFVQGKLHPDLHNNPTFVTDFVRPTHLRIHIRSVASQGARVTVTVPGGDSRAIALNGKPGQNDPTIEQYDTVFDCLIPPGPHRVMLDNDGPDWAVVDWLEFSP